MEVPKEVEEEHVTIGVPRTNERVCTETDSLRRNRFVCAVFVIEMDSKRTTVGFQSFGGWCVNEIEFAVLNEDDTLVSNEVKR